MTYNKENEPQEKEVFEEPKMVNLEGKEITDKELEDVSGGAQVEGNNTCDGGTGDNNTCSNGSGFAELA